MKATPKGLIMEMNPRFKSLDVGERPVALLQDTNLGEEIAKRFNSHDKLVEAVRVLRTSIKRFIKSSACTNNCAKDDMSCDTQYAKKALTQTEGLV